MPNFASSRRAAPPPGRTRPRAADRRPTEFHPRAPRPNLSDAGRPLTVDIHAARPACGGVPRPLTARTAPMTAAPRTLRAGSLPPAAATCSQSPYSFRPMTRPRASTPASLGRPLLQTSRLDEIGHFEYCTARPARAGDCLANQRGRARLRHRLLQPGVLAARPHRRVHRPDYDFYGCRPSRLAGAGPHRGQTRLSTRARSSSRARCSTGRRGDRKLLAGGVRAPAR